MPLPVGDKFGHFEILAPIGAGGMGEVYRARDSKLKRDVAVKVLPEAFARDPERMARFQRDAEVLASLNHPNIAHIYGVEDRALVRLRARFRSTRPGKSRRRLQRRTIQRAPSRFIIQTLPVRSLILNTILLRATDIPRSPMPTLANDRRAS